MARLHYESFEDAAVDYPLIRHTSGYKEHLAKLRASGKVPLRSYSRSTRKRAMLQNPIAPNQADILPWILYDFANVPPNTAVPATLTLFNTPIGQGVGFAGGVKTKTDTNLEQVSRLPDPQWFNCTHLGIYFHSTMLKADIDQFLARGYFEFWIGQKVYAEGKIQKYPAGSGLYGMSTNTTEAAWQNGWPMGANLYDLRLPAGMNLGIDRDTGQPIITDGIVGQTILQGQQFFLKIFFPNSFTTAASTSNGTGVNLWVFLDGILSRGVQ
jgi:hypothetical protein